MIPIKMLCIKCGKLIQTAVVYKRGHTDYFDCPYCNKVYKAVSNKSELTVNINPINELDDYEKK